MTSAQGKLRFYVIIFFVILLDQITKAVFGTSCNTGIAFGFLRSFGVFNTLVPIMVVSACFYYLLRQQRQITAFALAFVIGGGLSNILDRLIIGCVRDFIDLKFWPSFNLADSAVTIGVAIIVFSIVAGKNHE